MCRVDHGPDQEVIRASFSFFGCLFFISLPCRSHSRPALAEHVTRVQSILWPADFPYGSSNSPYHRLSLRVEIII